ncbi:hypothetical protein Tco_0726650 [Tanacetum coccineum]|uniref:Uncharacterized protein n=1 Tax=Tanacetum coccineum TaxID=301880 RepID=A0ABQ4YG61_9ASTR
MSPGNVAREGIPFELFCSLIPGDMSPGKRIPSDKSPGIPGFGEGVKVKDNNLLGKFTLNVLALDAKGNSELEVCSV